ncbi:MAG: hypothetical protein NC400_12210 [Clostridium sp.]|nr:hypothetical protein [Clostridium sp.]
MYDFYLDGVLLPVAPSELKMTINNQNDTYVLIDQGEINLLKRAGLTEIEFECLLPQVQYPFAVYVGGFKPAAYYLKKLEQLKVSCQPFQFIASRILPSGQVLFSNNIKVSLEDYTVSESADNGFDVQVKIRLKQYRDFGTQKVELSQNERQETIMGVHSERAADNAPERDDLGGLLWQQ